jgi:hypothetical protein
VSAYDTIDRDPRWWVRVYCETPMTEPDAVMLELGKRAFGCLVAVEYMSPDDAIRLATALLNAAAKAQRQLKVDAVLEGTR